MPLVGKREMTLATHKQCSKQKQELGAVNDLIARLNVLLSFPDFQGNLNEILCRIVSVMSFSPH
jgi:hypothetical protein